MRALEERLAFLHAPRTEENSAESRDGFEGFRIVSASHFLEDCDPSSTVLDFGFDGGFRATFERLVGSTRQDSNLEFARHRASRAGIDAVLRVGFDRPNYEARMRTEKRIVVLVEHVTGRRVTQDQVRIHLVRLQIDVLRAGCRELDAKRPGSDLDAVLLERRRG